MLDDQLGGLLDDTLSILLAPTLPMISSRKSHMFSFWILHTQLLPSAFLVPRNSKLVPGLVQFLKVESGVECTIESLKVE